MGTWDQVFNTPLECGLRSAALLLVAYPHSCDLQRLVQYDYLVVHSGDVTGGPPSIHPSIPHRAGELLVRRDLVQQGLDFMGTKMVVERAFTKQGIAFIAGDYAVTFLEALTTPYISKIRERAQWVVRRFQTMADQELASYMRARWSQWGAEFVRSALLEEVEE